RKEDLGVADADEAEHRGDHQAGHEPAGQERFHGHDVQVLDDERGTVGRGSEIDGVAEREQAGIPQQQIHRQGGDRHDEAVGQQDRLVRRCDVGEADEQRGDQRNVRVRGRRRRSGRGPAGGGGRGVHDRLNSPAGRVTRTRAAMRYSTASSSSGKNVIASVRTTATMNAPASAPSRLPRPPMTTTTNASTSASTPMPSTAPWMGTITAPANPAIRHPMAKASTYTLCTLMPRA